MFYSEPQKRSRAQRRPLGTASAAPRPAAGPRRVPEPRSEGARSSPASAPRAAAAAQTHHRRGRRPGRCRRESPGPAPARPGARQRGAALQQRRGGETDPYRDATGGTVPGLLLQPGRPPPQGGRRHPRGSVHR